MFKIVCTLLVLAAISIACDEIPDNELGDRISAMSAVDANAKAVTGTVDINGDGNDDLPLFDGCTDPFVDQDGDGEADFLDLDCNGLYDLRFGAPDGTGECIPVVIDSANEGAYDAIDIDCDAEGEFDINNLSCATPIDNNSDGIYEGIDLDCDKEIDIVLENVPCEPTIIDENNDGTPEGIDLDCDGTVDMTCGCQAVEVTACLDDGYRGCRRGGESNWVIDKRGWASHRGRDGVCGSDGYYSVRWGGSIDVLMTVQDAGEYELSFMYRVGTAHQKDEALRVEVNEHQRFDFEDSDLDNSGEWEESQAVTVTLKSGINFVTFKSIGRDSVHLEQVTLRKAGSCNP